MSIAGIAAKEYLIINLTSFQKGMSTPTITDRVTSDLLFIIYLPITYEVLSSCVLMNYGCEYGCSGPKRSWSSTPGQNSQSSVGKYLVINLYKLGSFSRIQSLVS